MPDLPIMLHFVVNVIRNFPGYTFRSTWPSATMTPIMVQTHQEFPGIYLQKHVAFTDGDHDRVNYGLGKN